MPEIIQDEKLKDRTLATLKIMAVEMLPNFDVLMIMASRPKPGESPRETKEPNLHITTSRLEKIVDSARKNRTGEWYAATLRCACNKLQDSPQRETGVDERGENSAKKQAKDQAWRETDRWKTVRHNQLTKEIEQEAQPERDDTRNMEIYTDTAPITGPSGIAREGESRKARDPSKRVAPAEEVMTSGKGTEHE